MINKAFLILGFLALFVGFIYTVLLAADSVCIKEEEIEESEKFTIHRCSL